jgi:ribose/xylose/arabinose/galactoside ABC-type transport system permease subunit
VAAALIGFAIFNIRRPNVFGAVVGAVFVGVLLNGLTNRLALDTALRRLRRGRRICHEMKIPSRGRKPAERQSSKQRNLRH